MYLSRIKNILFHSYDIRNKSDLFITPNYLNTVSLTMVCLFITIYFMKLSVKCIIKFKKILNKFSLEKNFYSGEEFMATDH